MPVPDRTDVLGGGPFGLIVSTREGSLPTTPHVTPYPGLCRPRAGRGKSRMRCQAAPLPGMIHPGSRDPSHRSARGLPVRHRRPGWPGGRGVFLPPFLGRSVKSIPALRALPPTALQGGYREKLGGMRKAPRKHLVDPRRRAVPWIPRGCCLARQLGRGGGR